MNTLKTIVLAVSLVALATPSLAAPRTQARDHQGQSLEQMVGKEAYEGEGRGHAGHLQAQRLSDCLMGVR
jgi:hypothetical protein